MTLPAQFFGRRYAPDSRDAPYRMRLLLDPLREDFFPRGLPEGARYYRPGPVLHQGYTGTCVAHGWTTRINSAPICQNLPVKPYDLYRKIVMVDEWPSNDGEATGPDSTLQSGTSVRAGAKVLQTMGFLTNYLWAEGVEDVRAWHLAGFGGLVFGTVWLAGMHTTDSSGFVHATGAEGGGHCWVSLGWNDRHHYNGRVVRALRAQNSWGPRWGIGGRFWVLEEDVAKLLAAQGEACAPVEQRVQPQGE